MRFPSIQVAIGAALETARRYPLVLASAVAAAVAAILLIEDSSSNAPLRLLLAATLGIPLFVALATLASRGPGSTLLRAVLPSLATLSLVGFFFAAENWPEPILFRRYAQFSVGLHAVVAVLAWAGRNEPNGFWQFNRRLFERFLVSAIFSAVLFLGLALALAALDKLFGIDVDGENYARLWCLIAFVFNTWYFLGGVPRRLGELEGITVYPQVLKVFSQFILVPLVLLYLLILTAYLGRVAITHEWPSGWIGYLVSGVSVLGILAILLVHPVRARPENRWVGTFTRGFWFALLPALAMLFLAIAKRIEQYGVTENRYFLVVFAVWLTGLALWYIVRRSENIAVIPWSLAVIAFATSFGPWSAYAVSESSQIARLQTILERNDLLEGDLPRAASTEVSFEDRREIAAALRYVIGHHGPDGIEPWFASIAAGSDSVRSDLAGEAGADRRSRDDRLARAFMSHLDLDYVEPWAGTETAETFSFHAANPPLVMDVRGWDYTIDIPNLVPTAGQPFATPDRFRASWDDGTRAIVVWDGESRLIEFPVDDLLDRAREAARAPGATSTIPAEALRVEQTRDGVRAALQLKWLSGERLPEGDRLSGLGGTVFLALP